MVRVGRLQIPRDYLRELGIDDRAVLRLKDGRIVIEPIALARAASGGVGHDR